MSRLDFEIKKNINLCNDLSRIEEQVFKITSKNQGYGITDHGLSHSKRIIEYLCELYDNYFVFYKQLNEYEIFILFAAAYLHDIGYYLEDEERIKDFCHWKKVNFPYENKEEFYRKMHHLISAYWILENLIFNNTLPRMYFGKIDFGYSVMKIVASHGINFWENHQYHNEVEINGYKIREIYLSYLLCMADAMDCDKRRNQNINKLDQYQIKDRIFIRRHDYVDQIIIHKDKIYFYIRKPLIKFKNRYIFDEFYVKRTIKWIYVLLEKGKMLFNDTKFTLQMSINVRNCSDVEEPTEDEYAFIIKIYI